MMGKEEQNATVDTQIAQYTPEEEKQVLRKIDFVVLPFVSGRPKKSVAGQCLQPFFLDVLRLYAAVPGQAVSQLCRRLRADRRPQPYPVPVLLVQFHLLRWTARLRVPVHLPDESSATDQVRRRYDVSR